jgi:hypothetical protein
LRGVLKFTGYRMLNAAVANATEGGLVSQTLSADSEPLSLTVIVNDLRVDGNAASVHLQVSLARSLTSPRSPNANVLSTSVTVPIGQTVVLGTSAAESGQRAMILTVRPQLAKK